MVIKLWLNQEAYMGWASGWNGGQETDTKIWKGTFLESLN
jgi:hypothetical protein